MGTIGTIGIFWSLSGFILRVIQSSKKIYLRGTNMFVLRLQAPERKQRGYQLVYKI